MSSRAIGVATLVCLVLIMLQALPLILRWTT